MSYQPFNVDDFLQEMENWDQELELEQPLKLDEPAGELVRH
jgi:hypothetical protein